jgi:heme exporter protein D
MSEFLSMGGHGAYLWPSYAVFLIALAWDALSPRLRTRRVQRQLELRLRRQAAVAPRAAQ